jgi:histidyl-tRNA synthetase
MAERDMYPAALARLDAVVAAAGDDKLAAALALSVALRRAGLRVDLRPQPVKPGKLRKHAEERGARAAIWIEPEHEGRASLWTSADQQTHRDVAVERIAELLGASAERRGGGS